MKPKTIVAISSGFLLLLVVFNCNNPSAPINTPPSSCQAGENAFANYTEAISGIRLYVDSAAVMTPKSSVILRAEYYHRMKERFMIIFFKSNPDKGYLYKCVSHDLWNKFNEAKSKGKFYNKYIRGNSYIYYSLPKA